MKKPLSTIALYLTLSVLAVLFLFPFYWLLISAFKTQPQIFATPPRVLPIPPAWENFSDIWRETSLLRAFINSTATTTGHCLLALFLCSLAGYAFAKFPRAPGNNALFAFVLSTMMIPGAVTLIPVFVIMMKLNLVNTYWAIIIPGAASAFGIFWMRQYMQANIPDDLIHAARIDGCTEFGIYCHVALPISRPALAALAVMLLVGSWNNLMWAFLMLRTEAMQTLPLLIYLLQGETRTPFGMLMAGGLVTTLPLIIAFLVFQRQFISGITSGAIKA
ncbi:MAG: carbohydrate ABC transporter permease [Gemmatimonadota bacterium]|nr:carbohydrate ABC transporter permease [Gemmatimonadota bacterium]